MKFSKRQKRVFQKSLVVCIATITMQGCFIFGSDNDSSEAPDVCEDVFNAFVSQDKDGIGVTSSRCAESARGDWIDGRCYCHGESDG